MSDQQTPEGSEQSQTAPETTAETTAGDSRTDEQTTAQDQAGQGEGDKAADSDRGTSGSKTADPGDKGLPPKTDTQQSSTSKVRRSSTRFKDLADDNRVLREENERLKAQGQGN